jgi:hypothetical protein
VRQTSLTSLRSVIGWHAVKWRPPKGGAMNILLLRCIVLSLVLIGAASAQPPTERNREVINRFYTLVNEGHWQDAAQLFAPDVRHHLGSWGSSGGKETIMTGR